APHARLGQGGLGRPGLAADERAAVSAAGGAGRVRVRLRRDRQHRCVSGLAGAAAEAGRGSLAVAGRLSGALDAAGHHRALCLLAADAAHVDANRRGLVDRAVYVHGAGGDVRSARIGRSTSQPVRTPPMNPFDRFARLYNWEHDRYLLDVPVHIGFARRFGGLVLELGCGSGRLLGPLAQAGFACTGVDSSSAMLERARVRLERLSGAQPTTLVEQRLAAVALDARFPTML